MAIAVIGLGYVGLPLSLQFARSGVTVLGLDIDRRKVQALNRGQSYIQHVQSEEIAAFVKTRHFSATTDFRRLAQAQPIRRKIPFPA